MTEIIDEAPMSRRTDPVDEVRSEESSRPEPQGRSLVAILYSFGRDLYRVPSMNKDVWLSVIPHPLPAHDLPSSAEYIGAAMTADGKAYRKAYSLDWTSVVPGDQVTVPTDDPMVLDYEAYSQLSLVRHHS